MQKRLSRGFTIVELLVVIVIIGILAAITLVSYTGINDRAKTAQALTNANAVQNIAEIYSTELGHYPDTVLSFADAITAKLPSTVTILVPPATLDSSNGATSILWTYDGTPGQSTGGTIQYWDFNTGAISTNVIRVGTGIGTVPPPAILTAKVLVVGGGGGGGTNNVGGGGGAGGYLYNDAFVVNSQSYSVVVGAGGAIGANGSGSSFDSLLVSGGGGGGSQGFNGLAGASGGGGGAGNPDNYGAGGSGIAGQGFAGGVGGISSSGYPSGGGGGAGAVGGGISGSTAGVGGVGIANSITGISVYYAGGGGGSAWVGGSGSIGGLGGGGNGASYNGYPNPGISNTGGGGGGASNFNNNQVGGSGVVIISYPTGSFTATGGVITTSGLNTIHTFVSNGSFTVL